MSVMKAKLDRSITSLFLKLIAIIIEVAAGPDKSSVKLQLVQNVSPYISIICMQLLVSIPF